MIQRCLENIVLAGILIPDKNMRQTYKYSITLKKICQRGVEQIAESRLGWHGFCLYSYVNYVKLHQKMGKRNGELVKSPRLHMIILCGSLQLPHYSFFKTPILLGLNSMETPALSG